jgi:hypothetical protein
MSNPEWHFPRKGVAERYFKAMSSGVMLSTTVFSPPQTGLSHFFIRDLMPYACEQGYSVAYVDLSSPQVPFTTSMLMAMDRLLTSESLYDIGLNFLKDFFSHEEKKTSRGVEFYKNSVTQNDEKYFQDTEQQHLELISQKVGKATLDGNLLLIFDGAHALAKDALSPRFTQYLKDLLLEHRDRINPIYGTSDLDAWKLTFQNSESPLHSEGPSIHKLPLLDIHFIRAWLDRKGLQIHIHEALQSFLQLRCKPALFIDLVSSWSTSRETSLLEYASHYAPQPQTAFAPSPMLTANAPCCS